MYVMQSFPFILEIQKGQDPKPILFFSQRNSVAKKMSSFRQLELQLPLYLRTTFTIKFVIGAQKVTFSTISSVSHFSTYNLKKKKSKQVFVLCNDLSGPLCISWAHTQPSQCRYLNIPDEVNHEIGLWHKIPNYYLLQTT